MHEYCTVGEYPFVQAEFAGSLHRHWVATSINCICNTPEDYILSNQTIVLSDTIRIAGCCWMYVINPIEWDEH